MYGKIKITFNNGKYKSYMAFEDTPNHDLFNNYQRWSETTTLKINVNAVFIEKLAALIRFSATHRSYHGLPIFGELPIRKTTMKTPTGVYKALMILDHHMRNSELTYDDKESDDIFAESDLLKPIALLLEMHCDVDGHSIGNNPSLAIKINDNRKK